jgi:hypothetical protein
MLERVTYPRLVGRAITHDAVGTSLPFRMSAGFAGDVTRAHPSAVIEPNRQSPTNPVLGFGFACIVDPATASVRQVAAGDSALTAIYGILVRFYPGQASPPPNAPFAQQPLGWPVVPPANQVCDVMRAGYIIVPVVGTPLKGNPVFIWVAASGGGHTQGGFEAAATAGSTIDLGNNSTFNSSPDAYGNTEIAFNI